MTENATPALAVHTLQTSPDLSLRLLEGGSGRPVLVLHGGGGPLTVLGLATDLARDHHVLAPTHPGWDGTARPDWFDSIDELALTYTHLLEARDLRDVAVVGSSIGGWVAAEMAVRDTAGRISHLVLVDAVGIEVPEEPMRDFFTLGPREATDLIFHDGDRFFVDPATLSEDQRALAAGNLAATEALAGDPYMHDPRLRRRLARVTASTTVVWGDDDGVVGPAYGRAYAASFREARFVLVEDAGHLPHVEQPKATLAVIRDAIAG